MLVLSAGPVSKRKVQAFQSGNSVAYLGKRTSWRDVLIDLCLQQCLLGVIPK